MKSIIEKSFNTNKIKLWNIITNPYDKFESNLLKTDIIDENNFIEYTRENIITKVEVIEKILHQKYKANIENQSVKGYFIITLIEESPNKTKIIFEIDVKAKNIFLNIGLKKKIIRGQIDYLRDLAKKLNIFKLDMEKINNVQFKDNNK